MTNLQRTLLGLMIGVIALVVIIAKQVYSDSDGIQENKVYPINATYKTAVGRQFDFKDRNVANGSIMVPLFDERGIPLVREDTSLPPSSVVKVHVYVKAREMEKVKYPAYDYIEWRYHLATVEPQVNTPNVILRK